MRLARVVGNVTGTIKDGSLTGRKLLVVDLVDSSGAVVDAGHVALDTVGAGAGDSVLVSTGSAARHAGSSAGLPTDMAIVLIVEEITIANRDSDNG
ncbi:MAG: EutN/CcmL family microcompartment protein [Acidimicrobiia bacterium]|nr:EutN/CcmL family microcompartment protein [Acidimicrobiia bacterium]MDH4306807.1 EutN/CcmL family microcompartment protein [Acidimicrobiia bacterium]MDH5294003.1 EutN/CcmL family microcompartment protein [Acidimicrobiia bacterium]